MFEQYRLKLALAVVALASASLIPAAATMAESKHHEDDYRQYGKHAHGAASMSIALDGQQLVVELDSPAVNILGFEHAADTPEDKAVAADMWRQLQHPEGVVHLEGGDCTLASSSIQMPQFDQGKAEDQHALLDSTHSDIEASYAFECAKPDELESIQIEVFETFPKFEEVDAQWIIHGHQGGKHLKAGDSTITAK